MNSINFFIIIICIFFTSTCFGGTAFIGQYGLLKLSQDAAQKQHVSPTGSSFGGGFSVRKDYLELETVYLQSTAEAKITHDNISNTLVHKQASVLVNLNFYLFKYLYARAGVGLHKISQSFKKPMSEASTAGAKDSYGVKDSLYTQGLLLGVGVVLLETSSVTIFTQLDKMTFPSMNSGAWNASLGFRFYVD
jgi:hypothetical protein